MNRILIFANGELPDLDKARALLRDDDFILCADGGTRHALTLGLTPNLVIGDMDSIEKGQWQELEKAGVSIELFPHDKNETDLELAIQRALELEPKQILILAALGGRVDQTLANIALLSDFRLSTLRQGSGQAFDVRLDDGVEEILFCRDQVQVEGRSGDIVSLLPWGAPVHGVQTKGLKWMLSDETLYPEKTRGVSNEMISNSAYVEIKSGLLLVIHRRQS
ncbi:MAG: thiamine diphosphokinase [Anaerolineales bacterium]|nr:thiamine diphosphokinase [Anaerolineales bacterium]NUQ84905.1 thiamine diphosphokinase [Anaerolineales bacterium]